MCYREPVKATSGRLRFSSAVGALRLPVLAVVLLLVVGCGYHLVGTTSFLPDDLQVLYVERFENLSSWTDVDQRLSEAVTQEWVRRRRFTLATEPDEADVALKGVIARVSVAPVTFDDAGRATEYQMTLQVAVELVDVRGEKPVVLWRDRAFSRRTSYEVDVSAVDYFDRQVEAMDSLSRDFARALVSAVLEGF